MTNDPIELQAMLDLADSYSQEQRYLIHPLKSTVVRRVTSSTWKQKEILSDWHMGSTNIAAQQRSTHLGLTRASEHEAVNQYTRKDQTGPENAVCSDENRSSWYQRHQPPKQPTKYTKHMNSPALLYSTETLTLTATHIQQLERFS